MSRRKYRIGRRIKSLDELMRQRFVYHKPGTLPREKIYHIGWVKSWPLHLASRFIETGSLYRAEPTRADHCNGGNCERHDKGAEPCTDCPYCDERGNI